MRIRLSFLGAAQNVTGSRYLLETNGTKVLVDCGLYQERQFRERNWDRFPVEPSSINAVLLTHAHLDHCGLLPKLVREGFNGKIYCTVATSEICRIVLMDSAHLQEEDAQGKRKRHEREGRAGPYPEVPLYTVADAKTSFSHLHAGRYKEPVQIGNGIEATFHDAGHILGSSMVEVRVQQNGERRTILFSGDLGRWDKPILRDPTVFEQADYVLIESTYGDRLHRDADDIDKTLADIVNTTHEAGGNIVIPSFATERAQELLYHLNELLLADRMPHLLVFLDSPMAARVTKIFESHPELFDEEMVNLVREKKSPFGFPGLKYVRSIAESKAINHIRGTVVIIAGSGMCTGGRVKYHLANNITRSESTILFVGYQAVGTLGRQIADGEKNVRIHGQMHPVKARIGRIHGFSAHADRNELVRWLSGLEKPPRHVFVTHGEPESAKQFASVVKDRFEWVTSVPRYREEVTLD